MLRRCRPAEALANLSEQARHDCCMHVEDMGSDYHTWHLHVNCSIDSYNPAGCALVSQHVVWR